MPQKQVMLPRAAPHLFLVMKRHGCKERTRTSNNWTKLNNRRTEKVFVGKSQRVSPVDFFQ